MMTALQQIRVLLVEDDPGDARLVRCALMDSGKNFWVHHVGCGRDACSWLAANGCDVILLDLSLPDSFGLNTVGSILAVAPHVPVIVLSGNDDDGMALAAVEAGAQDYLVKGRADGEVLQRSIHYAILRKQMEERLRHSEERLKSIIELAHDAIIAFDADRNIILFNPAAEHMFGWPAPEVIGRNLSMLMPLTETPDCSLLTLSEGMNNGQSQVTGLRRDGREFPAEVGISRVSAPGGTIFTVIIRDISERKRFEEELLRLATTDALTGLPNRRSFLERAQAEFDRLQRYGGKAGLLMLDIDFFKKVNDNHGHAAGDEVLRGFAQTCRGVLRMTDVAGRLGGEEFAVLLPETACDKAFELAERLRQTLAATPIETTDGALFITVSIGIASLTGDSPSLEQVMAKADEALYRAKSNGRNRVELAC